MKKSYFSELMLTKNDTGLPYPCEMERFQSALELHKWHDIRAVDAVSACSKAEIKPTGREKSRLERQTQVRESNTGVIWEDSQLSTPALCRQEAQESSTQKYKL